MNTPYEAEDVSVDVNPRGALEVLSQVEVEILMELQEVQ